MTKNRQLCTCRLILVTLLISFCTASSGWAQAASSPTNRGTTSQSTWRPIMAPTSAQQHSATWIEIDAPNNRKLVAAVFTPPGTGPFPVVVLLHASSGFWIDDILPDFARAGFLTVAGCWFAGSSPYDPVVPSLVPCPAGPRFNGATLDQLPYIDAIVKAARTLPGAKGDRLGVVGKSRGATMAVLYASNGGEVRAVVADSANYTVDRRPADSADWPSHFGRRSTDSAAIDTAKNLATPLLMLHGTSDRTVSVSEPREYEKVLVRLSKPYEAKYYENAPHVLLRKINPSYSDAMNRSVEFLKKYLGQ